MGMDREEVLGHFGLIVFDLYAKLDEYHKRITAIPEGITDNTPDNIGKVKQCLNTFVGNLLLELGEVAPKPQAIQKHEWTVKEIVKIERTECSMHPLHGFMLPITQTLYSMNADYIADKPYYPFSGLWVDNEAFSLGYLSKITDNKPVQYYLLCMMQVGWLLPGSSDAIVNLRGSIQQGLGSMLASIVQDTTGMTQEAQRSLKIIRADMLKQVTFTLASTAHALMLVEFGKHLSPGSLERFEQIRPINIAMDYSSSEPKSFVDWLMRQSIDSHLPDKGTFELTALAEVRKEDVSPIPNELSSSISTVS